MVGRELDRDATLETAEHGGVEVRDAPVEDLALTFEGLEGLAHLVRLHEHVWTVKQHRVDVIDAHARKAGVDGLDDVLLREVIPREAVRLLSDTDLRLQEDAIAQARIGGEDLAEGGLAGAASVDVGDVQGVDALVERGLDELRDLRHAHLFDAHEANHDLGRLSLLLSKFDVAHELPPCYWIPLRLMMTF